MITPNNTLNRSWESKISMSGNYDKHLKYWEKENYKYGFRVDSVFIEKCKLENQIIHRSLIQSNGIEEHDDRHLKARFSALLILYNKGFSVRQKGIQFTKQTPGTIILLDIHATHELAIIDARAKKWVALALDYNEPLDRSLIENELKIFYCKLFNL